MEKLDYLIYDKNGFVINIKKEFEYQINWNYISIYQKLSESFIEKYEHKVNWDYISASQKLSESFIEKFEDRVNWDYISKYQKLSESSIEKFEDKVNWFWISECQKLTESFIEKYEDKVNLACISASQKLSESFIEKYQLEIAPDNWLYKSTEFKKQQIVDCGKYECFGDYFIAYKGIRSDRYSKFNFQFKYEKNKTYETHADFTDSENSFGLSVWTKEQAQEYCDELVVKCKIKYSDVARLVHNSNKIRCTKITILN